VIEVIYLGLMLIFIGFMLLMVALLLSIGKRGEGKVEGGGVVIIGPIPIVFGSNQKIATGLLVLAIVLVALLIILKYSWWIS